MTIENVESETVNRSMIYNTMVQRKRRNNDLQNITQKFKLKLEEHEPLQKPGVNSGAPEGLAVPVPLVTLVVSLL